MAGFWQRSHYRCILHAAVIYVPFLQEAFSTVALNLSDWLYCVAIASSVLWLRKLSKVAVRATSGRRPISPD